MKTLAELEELRNTLINRFYEEGTILSNWTSKDIAEINAKANKEEDWAWNDSWRILKANSALLGGLGSAISALDKMIKERTKKDPIKKDAATEALEKLRGG